MFGKVPGSPDAAAEPVDPLQKCREILDGSPTFRHILEFAFRMEAKLAQNRHKGNRDGWLKDDPIVLVERMLDETVEVQQCFTYGNDGRAEIDNAEALADECADVANFAMMTADSALTDTHD